VCAGARGRATGEGCRAAGDGRGARSGLPQELELGFRLAQVALDPGAVAQERAEAGQLRQQPFVAVAVQDDGFQIVRATLPPVGEGQLLDPVPLDLVDRTIASGEILEECLEDGRVSPGRSRKGPARKP
jgi:hypothetical protein